MIGAIFLLGLSSFTLAGEPEPFENYFDDSLKGVDISQDSAIKACLQNGDTLADKVKAVYGKCFGNDYDFDDLAINSGSSDADSDGLPDSFEGNEACFYKEMNWVDASGNAAADAIKADMTGLEASEKAEFDNNIDACAAWSGSFGSRKKREVNVPEVMENDNKALNWLRSIVRKTRSADPGQKKEDEKKGKGRKSDKGTKATKSGKGGKAKKSGKSKGGNRRKSDKGGKAKQSRKSGKGKGKNGKGNKSGKSQGGKGGRGGKSDKRSKRRKSGKDKGGKARKSGKGKNKGDKQKKSDKNDKANKSGKSQGGKSDKRSKQRKSGKDKGGETVKSKKNNEQQQEKSANKAKSNENKPRKSQMSQVLTEQTYNKLWCFDLSMEQVLEKCVEKKIKN